MKPVFETTETPAGGDQTQKGIQVAWGAFFLRLVPCDGSMYVDVYRRGAQGESVASLRIDEDEGTVTFYDPGADEGQTVFEAGVVEGPLMARARRVMARVTDPDSLGPRSLDALVNDWHRLLQSDEDTSWWGWDLFEQDATGFWTIQRDDDMGRFTDDDEAIAYVTDMAMFGHEGAQLAVGIHYHPDNAAFVKERKA